MERPVAGAILRGAFAGALGFVLLAVLPLADGPLRRGDAVIFVLGPLLLAAAVTAAAIRERRAAAGDGSNVDGARIEHLVALVLWAVAFFAIMYVRLAGAGEFDGLVTRLDAVYFTVTTLTTVGFGDIHATGQAARLAVTVQIVFNVVVLAAAVRVLGGVLRRRSGGR
jgi:voltage-gated potassium channel